MAQNSYTYVLGQRWTEGEATTKDRLDRALENADHLKFALDTLIADTDDPGSGIDAGTITKPIQTVLGTQTLQEAWWRATDGSVWRIGRVDDSGSVVDLTRQNAKFVSYVIQPIADVPIPAS